MDRHDGIAGIACDHGRHQLAQIVAIDSANDWIDVVHLGRSKRIDCSRAPAIRPAAAISLRDAWQTPVHAKLAIQLTDSSRAWSTLMLAASRIGHAKLHVDPTIARTAAQLIGVTRRSLPSALPSHRQIRPDDQADLSAILKKLDIEFIPEPAPARPRQPPQPFGFAEEVRHRLTKNAHTRLAYALLHQHVGKHNPDHQRNAERVLVLCSSELTKNLVRFLAEIEPPPVDEPELGEFDLPFQISELEPKHYTPLELYRFEWDLNQMTVRACGWGLIPPTRPIRPRHRTRPAINSRA